MNAALGATNVRLYGPVVSRACGEPDVEFLTLLGRSS